MVGQAYKRIRQQKQAIIPARANIQIGQIEIVVQQITVHSSPTAKTAQDGQLNTITEVADEEYQERDEIIGGI